MNKKVILLLVFVLCSTYYPVNSQDPINDQVVYPDNQVSMHLGLHHKFTLPTALGFSAGLQYEHLFVTTTPVVGLGIFTDAVLGERNQYMFGFPVYFHPVRQVAFYFAPSYLIIEDSNENARTFMIRLGVDYNIEIEQYSISPTIKFDLWNKEMSMLVGVAFGISF